MVNKVILLGRIGNDVELKKFDDGGQVANVSMATKETYKDKNGEKQEVTEWHNLTIYGKRAEALAKYVGKGNMLYVEGKIKTRTWEKDGVKHYAKDVIVSDFSFVGSKKTSETQRPEPVAPTNRESDDDLPF